jgi:hypothetical protein
VALDDFLEVGDGAEGSAVARCSPSSRMKERSARQALPSNFGP